ncbi:hypothetical protein THAOC_32037, partial [Thalassiosira oceanica]
MWYLAHPSLIVLSLLSSIDAFSSIDPLLTSYLLRSVRADDGGKAAAHFTFNDYMQAAVGLQSWESSLRKGRLPLGKRDFVKDDVWPEEPLFGKVTDVMSRLGLPRLIRRHPEIKSSVLLEVARIVVEFTRSRERGKLVVVEDQQEDEVEDDPWAIEDDDTNDSVVFEYRPMLEGELDKLADQLAGNIQDQFGSVVNGVSLLDKVFGYDHGLLDMSQEKGFGLQDGVWSHTGWRPLPELQRTLSQIPELKELLGRLGKRPSSLGEDMKRFQKRTRSFSQDDQIGVELDPLDPTALSGLTLSGQLTAMLPSEAVLLRSSFKSLRWLFLAKRAEGKLLSYEQSGWTDVPTKPLNTRRSARLPSETGGPLILCLDTSYSMAGAREDLAKSVVLACVSAAHSQSRECRVVSFSSASNAIESGSINCDARGVKRLLDFLSYSFGGGTDVTGALKFAVSSTLAFVHFHESSLNINRYTKMEALESDMASSDLILVTDGELPNPPISKLFMSKLKLMQQQTGLEIHGLLVGKQESESLDMLCDNVHTFLDDYETSQFLKTRAPALALSSVSENSKPPRSSVNGYGFVRAAVRPFRSQSSRLFATMKPINSIMRHNKKQRRRNSYDDEEDWDFNDEDDDYPFIANGGS